jgi:hypothetical protein
LPLLNPFTICGVPQNGFVRLPIVADNVAAAIIPYQDKRAEDRRKPRFVAERIVPYDIGVFIELIRVKELAVCGAS